LLGALLVGGVSQTFLWRWGYEGLASVTGSQFMWMLLTFGVSWVWAGGRLRQGVAAGGLTGLALIASYYAMQWVADGRHSAVAQFAKTGGVAWTLAAVGGGAVMGIFGALAGMEARVQPRLKASGMTTPAVIAAVGPPLWIWATSEYLDAARLLPAVATFVLVSAVLLLVSLRTCGAMACMHALALSTAVGAAALVALLVLQTQGWLYLTF
jgi:hypothetical protein